MLRLTSEMICFRNIMPDFSEGTSVEILASSTLLPLIAGCFESTRGNCPRSVSCLPWLGKLKTVPDAAMLLSAARRRMGRSLLRIVSGKVKPLHFRPLEIRPLCDSLPTPVSRDTLATHPLEHSRTFKMCPTVLICDTHTPDKTGCASISALGDCPGGGGGARHCLARCRTGDEEVKEPDGGGELSAAPCVPLWEWLRDLCPQTFVLCNKLLLIHAPLRLPGAFSDN